MGCALKVTIENAGRAFLVLMAGIMFAVFAGAVFAFLGWAAATHWR
jgi:hypothetical protein